MPQPLYALCTGNLVGVHNGRVVDCLRGKLDRERLARGKLSHCWDAVKVEESSFISPPLVALPLHYHCIPRVHTQRPS